MAELAVENKAQLGQLLLTRGIVTEQQIAHSQNDNSARSCIRHRIWYRPSSLSLASMMCTAHARQGSNDLAIRTTSNGFSSSRTLVPIKACSIGPGLSWSSRGETFQVVGTTS